MMAHPHTLVRWEPDAIAAWERAAPTVADDPHARIALVGPPLATGGAVEAIPTWSADTPAGTWIEVQLQARFSDRWSKLYRLAAWDGALTASRRTSFDSQADDDGRVATDTLLLATPPEALRVRVLLCAEPGADMPELDSLALCLSASDKQATGNGANAREASSFIVHPSSLHLPLLISQYTFDDHSPWCSPTSLVMVLAYWYARTDDPRLAPFQAPQSVPATAVPMTYDPGWEGTGNWAFNTAFAASLGLTAYVTRLHSLTQLARWTAAGVPVLISVAWQPGAIEGASGSTTGHITVVTGFEGDRALIAEPASRDPAQIARRYRADQLSHHWQSTSSGTVYLVYPMGWPRPVPGPGDAWV